MVGVADAAGQVGIILAQQAMQCGQVLPLIGHVGMTGYAPVSHGGGTPEGGVAQVTLAGNFCMGAYPTQPVTDSCIECTGVEHQAALCKREP